MTIPSATFLQPQGHLSSLCSCPSAWAQLRESLEQAHCLTPHHRHTCCSPYLPYHLAKKGICVPLPTCCPTHCCASSLGKKAQQAVKILGQVAPGTGNKLAFLQPTQSSEPGKQGAGGWLWLSSPRGSCPKETDVKVPQCPLVLSRKFISSSICSFACCAPRVPSLARTYTL